MRSFKFTAAWWAGAALLAVAFGQIPAPRSNAAQREAPPPAAPVAEGDAGTGSFPHATGTVRRLRLGSLCDRLGDAAASPVVALQGGGDGDKVVIRHPRDTNKGKKAMPKRFVAAVTVAAPRKDVKRNKVEAAIVDKDGKRPAYLKKDPKTLRVIGRDEDTSVRVFILVEVDTPAPVKNPHKLTVTVTLPSGKAQASQLFDYLGEHKFIGLDYPPTSPYTVEGLEREYFVPCGPSSASITVATLGKKSGLAQWDDSDEENPIWWAEFTGLSASPGPGKYPLVVKNSDNNSIPQTDIEIAAN